MPVQSTSSSQPTPSPGSSDDADRPAASFLDRARAASHILCAIKDGRDDLLTEGVFSCCDISTMLTGINATHWDFGGHGFIGAKSAIGLAAVGVLLPNVKLGVAAYVVASNGASSIKNAVLGGVATARARSRANDDAFKQAVGFSRDEVVCAPI